MKPHKVVTIVVDGSSLGNGRAQTRAACAGLLGFNGQHRAIASYLGSLTNQQAEIMAATLALDALKEPCRVHLHTDSEYVVNTMRGRNRRRTNHQWWSRLDRAAARHRVEWNWIKGHSGHPQQEAVDTLAREVAGAGRVNPQRLEQLAARFDKLARAA